MQQLFDASDKLLKVLQFLMLSGNKQWSCIRSLQIFLRTNSQARMLRNLFIRKLTNMKSLSSIWSNKLMWNSKISWKGISVVSPWVSYKLRKIGKRKKTMMVHNIRCSWMQKETLFLLEHLMKVLVIFLSTLMLHRFLLKMILMSVTMNKVLMAKRSTL